MNNEEFLMGEIDRILAKWGISISSDEDLQDAIRECCLSFAQDAMMDSDIAEFVDEKMLEIV